MRARVGLLLVSLVSFIYAGDFDSLVSQSTRETPRSHHLRGIFLDQTAAPEKTVTVASVEKAGKIDTSTQLEKFASKTGIFGITQFPAAPALERSRMGGSGFGSGAGGSGRAVSAVSDTVVVSARRSGSLTGRVAELEKEIKDSKDATSQIKTILENLQKQSKSHTDNQNFLAKMFEILLASFLTPVVIAVLTIALKKKAA